MCPVEREEYSSLYLSLLISFITVGLTVSLFLLTIIGWFPDLYSTSKYIGQAYVLFTNMVALMTAGFVVLSTFVPSISACNTVLILVHFTIFLFLTSEFLVHLDFYTAIVLPFWHEEKVASNENAATFICLISVIGSIAATGGLFFNGNLMCPEDKPCTIVPIINMTIDESTSSIVLVMTASLFGIVFLSCCHIFLIALQKLRANVVVAPSGQSANNLSGTTKRFMVKNGDGILVYEDDIVSKEVKSAARTPFADPMFLHAIGSTFLQRVSKNTEQPEPEPDDDPPPQYEEAGVAKPSGSCQGGKESIAINIAVPIGGPSKLAVSEAKARPASEDEASTNERLMGSDQRADSKEDSGDKELEVVPINLNLELWKALTKSFRFALVTIASYGFLLLPSSGLALRGLGYDEYTQQISPEYAENPTSQFYLSSIVWRASMALFVAIRTLQPIVLAKMDKTISNKIGVIISDDVED